MKPTRLRGARNNRVSPAGQGTEGNLAEGGKITDSETIERNTEATALLYVIITASCSEMPLRRHFHAGVYLCFDTSARFESVDFRIKYLEYDTETQLILSLALLALCEL